jgi:hypothetical protein
MDNYAYYEIIGLSAYFHGYRSASSKLDCINEQTAFVGDTLLLFL